MEFFSYKNILMNLNLNIGWNVCRKVEKQKTVASTDCWFLCQEIIAIITAVKIISILHSI